jgi:hypothetical protein
VTLYRRNAIALALSLAIFPTFLNSVAHAVAQDAITNTYSFPAVLPSATAISPDGTFAIVASTTTGVYRINLLTNTVVDTITVTNGGYRTAITPNGRFALILNQTDGLIYKMDLSNDSITATISGITSVRSIAVSPDSSYAIAVGNLANSNYYKIDLATNAVTTYSGVLPSNTFEVSISPDGTKALFSTFNTNQFHLVDLTTNLLIRSYSAGGAGLSIWTSDNLSIYACNQQGSFFYKIDPGSTNIATNGLPGGGCTSMALTPDGTNLLISAATGAIYRYLTSNLTSPAATITGFSSLAWDLKIGSNSTDGVFALLTDRTNKRVSRIYQSGPPTPATLTLSSPSSIATYRASMTLTASSNAAGKVTFYVDGKKVPGCISVSTTFSTTHNATCSWKPSVHKAFAITAIIKPTGTSATNGQSNSLTISAAKRTGNR